MDHGAVVGACASCHNNTVAAGKPPTHIQTSQSCDDCHTTSAWTPTHFDHTAVTGTCFSCHNGTVASGKHPTHLATSNTCDNCHVTTTWNDVRFDHTGVSATCTSCHNGTTATGKNAGHVQTSADCDGCHTTTAWVPANFDHTLVIGSCSSCHNGVTAAGKPANHFITSVECDDCHALTNWTFTTYDHATANYPGDHRSSVTCLSCHTTNSQTISWRYPSYSPDCAGCHANEYESGEHRKTQTPATYYTVGELRDCAGSCHTYTDSSLTTVSRYRNSHHRVSDGEFH